MNNADWWASKLNNTTPAPQQGRPLNIPTSPSQVPMQQMPSFQQAPPTKAQSANQVATCPDCGSNNYMSPSPQIAPRCTDCGYPVQQSGSRYGSLAGSHVDGTIKQAVGNSSTSGFSMIPEGYNANGQKIG